MFGISSILPEFSSKNFNCFVGRDALTSCLINHDHFALTSHHWYDTMCVQWFVCTLNMFTKQCGVSLLSAVMLGIRNSQSVIVCISHVTAINLNGLTCARRIYKFVYAGQPYHITNLFWSSKYVRELQLSFRWRVLKTWKWFTTSPQNSIKWKL